MSDDLKPCSRCNDEPAGEGGILGVRCLAELDARTIAEQYGDAEAVPMNSCATMAAINPGTMNPGRPLASAVKTTAASGTR